MSEAPGQLVSEDPIKSLSKESQDLSPLPFTYVRTQDKSQAQYIESRVSIVSFPGEPNPPRTDEELIQRIGKQREERDWFTQDYWQKKGQPAEQIELQINGTPITVYNWNKNLPFTDEHIERTQEIFKELASRFPKIIEKLRYILIDDIQTKGVYDDPERYPINGYALTKEHAFKLFPRGMGLFAHRIAAASNFEGTFAHELTHLIQRMFESEWTKQFQWAYCCDHPEDWEFRQNPGDERGSWFSKKTGERAPLGQFPLQPDQCITYYAKINPGEDICESMVAYIYDSESLKKVSPEKYTILQSHDEHKDVESVSATKIPKDQIKLPEIKSEVIKYYIEEPKK